MTEPNLNETIALMREDVSVGRLGGDYKDGWDAALSEIADRLLEDKKPKPDFDGFTAKDLEDYIQSELIDNESGEAYWDELRTVLEDGGFTPWKGDRIDIKPFPHGKVLVEDDEETGGEGSQESIYIVFSVESYDNHPFNEGGKRYFRKQGYYASYDGSNWDGDFHEVWPKQKEITVWVSKKP
jgi:hypothetical protein